MVQFNQLVIFLMFASIHPNSKSTALKLKLNLDIQDTADSKEIEIKTEDLSKSHHNRHKHEKSENPEDDKPSHFLGIDPAIDFFAGEPKTIVSRSNFLEEDSEDVGEGYAKDYPYFEIKLYMQERPHLQKYLSPPSPKIGNRFGVAQEELENDGETLCKAHINEHYRPQKLKNVNGMDRFIVNDEEYQQFLRTEKCSSQSSRCHSLNLLGSTTSCVQRYSTRRLVVFTNDTFNEIDDFAIPSCCVCKMKKDKDSLFNLFK